MLLKFHEDLFHQLDCYRETGEFCDYAVTIGKDSFSVHRNILAAASPFIKEAIKQDEYTVKLDSCTELAFQGFLDFVYRGGLTFDPTTVLQALEVAKALQCQAYREECVNYMKSNINEETCVAYVEACTSDDLAEIHKSAMDFLCKNIVKVVDDTSCIGLSKEMLQNVLQNAETRPANTSMDLVTSCIKWCEKNPDVEPMEVIQLLELEKLAPQELDTLLDMDFVKQHHDIELELLQTCRKNLQKPSRPIDTHVDIRIWGVSTSNQTISSLVDITCHPALNPKDVKAKRNINIDGNTQVFTHMKKLYFLAINSGTFMNFDFGTQTWTILQSTRKLGTNRAFFSLEDNYIYTVGSTSSYRGVDRFNVTENRWEAMKDAPGACLASSACVVDGRVFISGGWATKKIIHEYHTETDTWTKECDMIEDRWCHFTCAFESKMFICSDDDVPVEVYDPATNQCTAINIAGCPDLGSCYQLATQVSPGIIYIYESDTDNFIVLDLKQNTFARETIEGLAANNISAIATIRL